jgi:hypothetical protein
MVSHHCTFLHLAFLPLALLLGFPFVWSYRQRCVHFPTEGPLGCFQSFCYKSSPWNHSFPHISLCIKERGPLLNIPRKGIKRTGFSGAWLLVLWVPISPHPHTCLVLSYFSPLSLLWNGISTPEFALPWFLSTHWLAIWLYLLWLVYIFHFYLFLFYCVILKISFPQSMSFVFDAIYDVFL